MPTIFDANDAEVFGEAKHILSIFQPKPLTQNFAVSIAVLMHRVTAGTRGPHRILYPPGEVARLVPTGDMQHQVCDRTWAKAPAFRPAGASIYKPFTTNFFPSTNNNWRNSFDLQAGLACDAPISDDYLRNDAYVAEHRYDCPFRDPNDARCSSPSGLVNVQTRTCFNPNKRNDVPPPGRESGAKHRPKLLTRAYREDGAPGYWFVEPTEDVLADLLGNSRVRLPLFPFMVALYAGSMHLGAADEGISEERFRNDLALGNARFLTLFDTDPRHPLNAIMLTHGLGGADNRPRTSPINVADTAGLSRPTPYVNREGSEFVRNAGADPDPERRMRMLERATANHRRTLNLLCAQLEEAGFIVTEQLDGYDLLAVRGQTECLFEVKTWTDANLAKQIRAGWAQLYEYRYRNSALFKGDLSLYLVFDHAPPQGLWSWPWLVGELGVVPCWVEEGRLTTFSEYSAAMAVFGPSASDTNSL